MAIVRVYNFPGGTLEQYDRTMDGFKQQLGGGLAPGNSGRSMCLSHARPQTRLLSKLDSSLGAAGLGAPSVSEFETHNLLRA